MKRRILLFALALCVLFCGCKKTSNLKENEFVWANEEHTAILSHDSKEYKLLEKDVDLIRCSDHFSLLREQGEIVGQPPEETSVYIYDDVYLAVFQQPGKAGRIFCLADRYDAVKSFLDSDNGDYGYYKFNPDTDRYDMRKLTEYEKSAIDNVIKTAECISKRINVTTDIAIFAQIYRADAELEMEKHEYDISVRYSAYLEGRYEYLITINTKETVDMYPVPEEYYPLFDNIIAPLK